MRENQATKCVQTPPEPRKGAHNIMPWDVLEKKRADLSLTLP